MTVGQNDPLSSSLCMDGLRQITKYLCQDNGCLVEFETPDLPNWKQEC